MVEGVVERQCNKCGEFRPLQMMRKFQGCVGGRASECRDCYRVRKQATRERARIRRVEQGEQPVKSQHPGIMAMQKRAWMELLNGAEMTYEEVAIELGITKQAVQQIEHKALRKLRRSGLLREFWKLTGS